MDSAQLSFKNLENRLVLFQKSDNNTNALFEVLKFIEENDGSINCSVILLNCRKYFNLYANKILNAYDPINSTSEFVQDLFFYASKFQFVKLYHLAEKTITACILLMKNSSESIISKLNLKDVFFELAKCQKSLNKLQSSCASLRKSYLESFDQNDILHQAKVLYELFETLYILKYYDEAIAACLHLFVLKQDLEENLNEDLPYFTAIVPEAGGEQEIHLKMCLAYKELLLFNQALYHFNHFERLFVAEISTGKRSELLNLKDVQNLAEVSGKLYFKTGDYTNALYKFKFWTRFLKEMKVNNLRADKMRQFSLMKSYKWCGKTLLKMKKYKEAVIMFEESSSICKFIYHVKEQIENNLLLMKAYVKLGREIKQLSLVTQDLSKNLTADFQMMYESQCLSLEAKELHGNFIYFSAISRLEQAIMIGVKSTRMIDSEIDLLKLKLAQYSMYSNKPEVLKTSLKFAVKLLIDIENRLYFFKKEAVLFHEKDSKILITCYQTIQVVLHKLNETELSICTTECFNKRNFFISVGRRVVLPKKLLEYTSIKEDTVSLQLIKTKDILCIDESYVAIYFTILKTKILVQIYKSKEDRYSSFLLFEDFKNSEEKINRLKLLTNFCCKQNKVSNIQEHSSTFYNTENRHVKSENSEVYETDLKSNKNVSDVELSYCAVIDELSDLLFSPFRSIISNLNEKSILFIVPPSFLTMIPFEQLINPKTKTKLGEDFNVSVSFYLTATHNKISSNYHKSQSLNCIKKTNKNTIPKTTSTKILSNSHSSTHHEKQTSSYDEVCVIGPPSTHLKLLSHNNEIWKMPKLIASINQCKDVSQYLNVASILGDSATIKNLKKKIKDGCNVLHICTFGNLHEGFLCFAPEKKTVSENQPVKFSHYTLTLDEIININMKNVKLVVLASCHSWKSCSFNQYRLVDAFANAGVSCVVFPKWSISNEAEKAFFLEFYKNLSHGLTVSKTVYESKSFLQAKYSNSQIWNCFSMFGRSDAVVNIRHVRNSTYISILNKSQPRITADDHILTKGNYFDEKVSSLIQVHFSKMLSCVNEKTCKVLINELITLIEEATYRISKDDNSEKFIMKSPEILHYIEDTKDLLKLAGFDFVKCSTNIFSVVFPHWNQHRLLLPLHQALTGLQEISSSLECVRLICEIFPMTQNQLCALIDLLAAVKQTPTLQLRISDNQVESLWNSKNVKKFMISVGFISIRSLLVFCRSLNNRKLLLGSLQLLIAFCVDRSHEILNTIDVKAVERSEDADTEGVTKILKSLQPVLMSNNHIVLKSPWMNSHIKEESTDRLELSNKILKVKTEFNHLLRHIEQWHKLDEVKETEQNVVPVTNEVTRVKVNSGGSPSCHRIPVEHDENFHLTPFEKLQQKVEARMVNRRIAKMREKEVNEMQKAAIQDCYVPFTHCQVE